MLEADTRCVDGFLEVTITFRRNFSTKENNDIGMLYEPTQIAHTCLRVF